MQSCGSTLGFWGRDCLLVFGNGELSRDGKKELDSVALERVMTDTHLDGSESTAEAI